MTRTLHANQGGAEDRQHPQEDPALHKPHPPSSQNSPFVNLLSCCCCARPLFFSLLPPLYRDGRENVESKGKRRKRKLHSSTQRSPLSPTEIGLRKLRRREFLLPTRARSEQTKRAARFASSDPRRLLTAFVVFFCCARFKARNPGCTPPTPTTPPVHDPRSPHLS